MLRWPRVMPLWQYVPDNVTFRETACTQDPPKRHRPQRDRYYTQARRLHLKRLLQGKV